ncbi:hypothetical protein ABKA04_005211 [Annulohypoxylon sp. FPYF3050]
MSYLDKAEGHIKNYVENYHPLYEDLTKELQAALETIRDKVAPQAIVQTRPKSVSSFSEKIFRKPQADPCNDLTDLCGGRIITHTTAEVDAVVKEIEATHGGMIDRGNSVNHIQRLKSPEFGYRSIHYIIEFKKPKVNDPEKTIVLRAEVQIRTLLEHAWADISHAYAYKSNFPIPTLWQRETFRAAALLENVDTLFARMQEGLEQYRVSYGAYMTRTQIREKVELLERMLNNDSIRESERANLAIAFGRLSVELDQAACKKAIRYISEHSMEARPDLLLLRGVLRCRLGYPDAIKSAQKDLILALSHSPSNVEALILLAHTYEVQGEVKGNNEKIQENYKKAFGLDPSSPHVLTSHLCWEIKKYGNSEIIRYVQPLVRKAIARSQDQIDMRINLPQAFYDTGLLCLLLGEEEPSFSAYCKAVQMSDTEYIINTHIESLGKLRIPKGTKIPGVEDMVKLLKLGVDLKFEESTQDAPPILIVSGNCDREQHSILESFLKSRNFDGEVLYVGSASELDRFLSGAIAEKAGGGSRSNVYKTYDDSLEMWNYIRGRRVSPKDVKLLGLGGFRDSGKEYERALALGAWVGLVQETQGWVDQILADKDWNHTERLLPLPLDGETIQAFILPDNSDLFVDMGGRDVQEKVAVAIHEQFREKRLVTSDTNLLPWDKLSKAMKQSSFSEANSIVSRLKTMGYEISNTSDAPAEPPPELNDDQVEQFAKMRHGRWNIERLKNGWSLGPKSEAEKKSPYLKRWDELDQEVQNWNRAFARDIPKILADAGLKIEWAPTSML